MHRLLLLLLLTLGVFPLSSSANWRWCILKGEQARIAPDSQGGSSDSRKYAPDRIIDVEHLKLEFTPDFSTRSLKGKATLTFQPISKPVREIRLDAIDLDILSVSGSTKIREHHLSTEKLVISLEAPVSPGTSTTLNIEYEAEPKEGLFFRTPELGYKKEDTHLWTQGEPQKHRFWFPSHDYPNERFSSEVICHVPSGMIVLSNGKLVNEQPREDGLTTFHWRQDQPHVNYLISVVAGFFNKLEDNLDALPLAFYTPPSEFSQAANSFADTKSILAYFQEEIGVPYPWDKYYSVCVQGYPYGGMENTSVTTLTTRTLFSKETENIFSTQGLDAHEIAHQWFGNLVTCKDWTHLWLNEGFATYYTELYAGHKSGRDHLLYGMDKAAKRVLSTNDRKPIAWRNYTRPWEQFDYRAYPKGAWVLHMLRSQVGDDLFRRCIRTYLQRHQNGTAVTEDLNQVFEEVTGQSWDRFFDQWVYHGGHPELQVDYSWDPQRKQAKLTVRQTQQVSDEVLLFHLPLPIRFHTQEGTHDFRISVTGKQEDFYFELPSVPTVVRIDPDYTVLAKVNLKAPIALTRAQAEVDGDVMGRILALRALAGRDDAKTREVFARRLESDPFYGVRIEAARALAKSKSTQDLEVLIRHAQQPDARVRQEVIAGISQFYGVTARDFLLGQIQSEANPAILAKALRGLGKYPPEEVKDAILTALERPSYRHRIAVASIDALRRLKLASATPDLLAHLKEHQSRFTDPDLGSALKTLAQLSRELENDETREQARQFIAGVLSSPRSNLHVAAMEALAFLGSARSIALLEDQLSDHPSREKQSAAARKAIQALSESKPPHVELSGMRQSLLDLQGEIRKLRSQVETLQKQSKPSVAGEKK